ncbi:hypothetical protein BK658_18865 [Pseudomonas brassicacearum]|uniref:Ubiquitin Mut7-C domain-containing protein n=1 Tax=Pseudomonas brassicacearum TaxID=930166 RepID=A0A423GPG6_9PSED|nr:hypothetical protein BK658_18865 [Pseudomonas brassicacearum]
MAAVHYLRARARGDGRAHDRGARDTEVELVQLNGKSVGFERVIFDGDRLAVYPKFEALDISSLLMASRMARPPNPYSQNALIQSPTAGVSRLTRQFAQRALSHGAPDQS